MEAAGGERYATLAPGILIEMDAIRPVLSRTTISDGDNCDGSCFLEPSPNDREADRWLEIVCPITFVRFELPAPRSTRSREAQSVTAADSIAKLVIGDVGILVMERLRGGFGGTNEGGG